MAPTKTQSYDDAVIIREPPFMTEVLKSLRGAGGTALALKEDPKLLAQQWKFVRSFIQEPTGVMYQFRHGGASRFLLQNPQGQRQLQSDLRHRTASSSRRYGKPGQDVSKQNSSRSRVLPACHERHAKHNHESFQLAAKTPVRTSPKPPRKVVPQR